MHFSAIIAIAAAMVVSAADLKVLVGDGGLTFTPPSVTAQSGDRVVFEFRAKNHSVTQSTFVNPCTKTGVDSGFQPVPAGATGFPQWTITIDDPTTPLWFFCAQTIPANHCNTGMVFAINPTPEKSFQSFQDTAKAATNASPAGSTPPTGATSAFSVPGTIVTDVPFSSGFSTFGASSTGFPFPSSSGFATFSTLATGVSGVTSASATLSGADPAATTNSAVRVNTASAGLLALVSVVAVMML